MSVPDPFAARGEADLSLTQSAFNALDMGSLAMPAQDTLNLARFYVKPMINHQATKDAGRPIYEDVTMLEIRAPGSRSPTTARPVRDTDKYKYARQWEQFAKGLEEPQEGTPLREWPMVTRSQVEDLAYRNLRTVEDVAAMADTHAGQMMGGLTLKRSAQDWLDSAENRNAPLQKMRAENDALKEQLAALAAKVEAIESAAPRRGPGRPRKEPEQGSIGDEG